MRLGDAGFMSCTQAIARAVAQLKRGIAGIDGLELLGDPVAMVVAFNSPDFNVYRLASALAAEGYSFSQCQHPRCVHICVTLRHVGHIDAILVAIRRLTATQLAKARAAGAKTKSDDQGAAIYGLASTKKKAAKGTVADGMARFMDSVYHIADNSKL